MSTLRPFQQIYQNALSKWNVIIRFVKIILRLGYFNKVIKLFSFQRQSNHLRQKNFLRLGNFHKAFISLFFNDLQRWVFISLGLSNDFKMQWKTQDWWPSFQKLQRTKHLCPNENEYIVVNKSFFFRKQDWNFSNNFSNKIKHFHLLFPIWAEFSVLGPFQ